MSGTQPTCRRCEARDVDRMFYELESYRAVAAGGWAWVAQPGPAGPAWHVAWALHGLPTPLPIERYPDVLGAIEAHHGTTTVLAGLRRALQIPPAHGSGVDMDRIAALLRRYERGEP